MDSSAWIMAKKLDCGNGEKVLEVLISLADGQGVVHLAGLRAFGRRLILPLCKNPIN
jgi:hypothetical protein